MSGPASPEAAFQGAGQSVGVEIWRVEKFNPVKRPPEEAGKFSKGDCYIVLHTFLRGSSKAYNVHFWLGSKASQDESGSAAMLTNTLDNQLGGLPVQFREIEGHESEEFLQIFPEGVLYLAGGVASGFKTVETPKHKTRLLHVHGVHRVRIAEVPVSVSSLNSSDCFVLDDGTILYQWNGKSATLAERSKALNVSIALKSDQGGTPQVIVLEDEDFTSADAQKFFAKLGANDLSELEIAPSISQKAAKTLFAPPVLYKIDHKDNDVRFVDIAQNNLKRDMLESDHLYIIHASATVYFWVGKNVPEKAKKTVWTTANRFLSVKELPMELKVQVVKEKLEPPLFQEQFIEWQRDDFKKNVAEAKTAKKKGDTEVDISAMVLGQSGKAAQELIVEDSTEGQVKVWRVEDFDLKEWPQEKYGEFLAGDSYVIQYTYSGKDGGERYIIYFWQGSDSPTNERGAAAALAAKLDDDLGGKAIQVRVVQNKEPNHFFRLFHGGMIVQFGGHNNEPEGREGPTGVALYQVKATNAEDVHAVQVTTSAESLNSGDVFILVDKSKAMIWEGEMSTQDERNFAAKAAARLAPSKEVVKLSEGDENEYFWESLGGNKDYPRVGDLGPPECPPRLFQITDATTGGTGVDVWEIFNFDQQDLDENDVMMLDTFREIFLWVGANARKQEKKEAFDLATKYLEEVSKINSRDKEVPITYVVSGEEPPIFTCHFLGWDDTKEPPFVDPYEEKLKNLMEEQAHATESELMKAAQERAKAFVDPLTKKANGDEDNKPQDADTDAPAAPPSQPQEFKYQRLQDFFPYEQLKTMRAEDGIDPAHREDYLSDADFEAVFSKSRKDFQAMPGWRQIRAKKEADLF